MIKPVVPRSNSHRITPLLSSTSKHLSKRGLHEPSQLLAKAYEESPLHADRSDGLDSSDCSDGSDGSDSSDSSFYVPAEASIVATVQDTADHNTRAQNLRDMPSLDSKEVGLPSNGLWDHDAAYAKRYCYNHGGYEYLLRANDTWMRLCDFVPANAKTDLMAKLEKILSCRTFIRRLWPISKVRCRASTRMCGSVKQSAEAPLFLMCMLSSGKRNTMVNCSIGLCVMLAGPPKAKLVTKIGFEISTSK